MLYVTLMSSGGVSLDKCIMFSSCCKKTLLNTNSLHNWWKILLETHPSIQHTRFCSMYAVFTSTAGIVI